MSSTWKNFKRNAKYGIVPVVAKNGNSVPQNSFYQSLLIIDYILGPLSDMLLGRDKYYGQSKVINNRSNCALYHDGMIEKVVKLTIDMVLQPVYLAFAYLSYLPAKGLSKVTDKFNLKYKTESLVDYSNTLSNGAEEHSEKVADFINTVLSYVCTAAIWAAALVMTPLVWAVDKVASKFSETKVPEAHQQQAVIA